MNIRKYFVITETDLENSNPGDVFIGRGIEYLLRLSEQKLDNFPIFNYVSLFRMNEEIWQRVLDEADYLILCGTPNFNKDGQSHIFNLLPKIEEAHKKGIVTAALWVGSGYTEIKYTEDDAVECMYKANETHIKKYGEVFDLIVTRDRITTRLFEKANIPTKQLCDSVLFAADYYDIQPKGNDVNLLVLRNLPGLEKEVVKTLTELGKQMSQDRPILWLCHNVEDYEVYKKYVGKNLICVNNPVDLLELYSRANQVVSFRIHGTVPATNFGKSVMNVSIDSRDDILKYFGAHSIDFNTLYMNPQMHLRKHHSEAIQLLKEVDKETFLRLWKRCQEQYAYGKLKESTKYLSKDYWSGKGKSSYGTVPKYCTLKSKEIADKMLEMKWNRGLELGCAGGHTIQYLDVYNRKFCGIDVSEYAIETGKKNWPKIKNRLHVGSIEDLSMFKDETFNIVYSQQVLEHLPTELVPKMIEELSRVTMKNAVLILYLVMGYWGQIARAETDPDATHINLKTKEWWTRQFSEKKFYVDNVLMEEFEKLGSGLHRIILRKVE